MQKRLKRHKVLEIIVKDYPKLVKQTLNNIK